LSHTAPLNRCPLSLSLLLREVSLPLATGSTGFATVHPSAGGTPLSYTAPLSLSLLLREVSLPLATGSTGFASVHPVAGGTQLSHTAPLSNRQPLGAGVPWFSAQWRYRPQRPSCHHTACELAEAKRGRPQRDPDQT